MTGEIERRLVHRIAGDVAATSTFLALARDALTADHPARADVEQAIEATAVALERLRALARSLAAESPAMDGR